MKTTQTFPFIVGEPRTMTVLEQVFSMVWLANNHSLKELRKRQSLIEAQMKAVSKNSCPEKVYENLQMMYDNTSAAVAYKSFDEPFWISFICAPAKKSGKQ